jgi:glycosyltransferase involved in cell wall biosynthesis
VKDVLIITPSLNVGGIGRHLSVFAESFRRKDLDVTMMSCLNHKEFYTTPEEIRVVKFPNTRKPGPLGAVAFYSSLVVYIRKHILRQKPEFIIVFGELFNPVVLLASIGTHYPVFIGDMTSADYNYGFFIKILRRLLYPSASGLICQTRYIERYRQKEFNYSLNTLVLDNPIREVVRYDIKREKTILYVGRFAWEKAPSRLIEAFAKIERKDGWQLVMAGDGPLLNEMKDYALNLGLGEKVKFLGKVSEVDRLFAESSIYVLPSILEGFPNALCEAMIAGLPVICFDGWPSNEIISHDENGIILQNEGGSRILSISLQHLIDDSIKRRRLGENAKRIRARLSSDKITDKLLDFIKESIK